MLSRNIHEQVIDTGDGYLVNIEAGLQIQDGWFIRVIAEQLYGKNVKIQIVPGQVSNK
jgi:hypothetical protein